MKNKVRIVITIRAKRNRQKLFDETVKEIKEIMQKRKRADNLVEGGYSLDTRGKIKSSFFIVR